MVEKRSYKSYPKESGHVAHDLSGSQRIPGGRRTEWLQKTRLMRFEAPAATPKADNLCATKPDKSICC